MSTVLGVTEWRDIGDSQGKTAYTQLSARTTVRQSSNTAKAHRISRISLSPQHTFDELGTLANLNSVLRKGRFK